VAVIGVCRVLQFDVLELFDDEGHALITVAAMAIAAVGKTADHRLVDLHPAGGLRPVGRDSTFCTLGGDRAWPV
jgi:hypothetical protein